MARARRVERILNVGPSRETEGDWRFEHADQTTVPASKVLPFASGSLFSGEEQALSV